MDETQVKRLRALLTSVYATDWHAGRTTGRALYHGDGPDDLIGVLDTRMLAELVILARQYAREQLLAEGAQSGRVLAAARAVRESDPLLLAIEQPELRRLLVALYERIDAFDEAVAGHGAREV